MSFEAWENLRVVLSGHIKRMAPKSRSPEPVTVNIIMGMGMRWLAGGKISHDRHTFHISYTETYRCCHHFIDGILSAKELAIHFPTNPDEWNNVRNGFWRRSRYHMFHGCVRAIDVFFQKTNAPSSTKVANVISYYSGHYESYGLNCQAACDARLKFLYFGIVAPGSTNDNIAFHIAKALAETISNLPTGLYMLGDAAYTLSEHLLIPFTGSQRDNPDNDAFNYHLSQLRIRIEMAFGRLVNKFR